MGDDGAGVSGNAHTAFAQWQPVLRRLLRQLTTILLYRDFDPMVMEPSAEALLALISADLVRRVVRHAPSVSCAVAAPSNRNPDLNPALNPTQNPALSPA